MKYDTATLPVEVRYVPTSKVNGYVKVRIIPRDVFADKFVAIDTDYRDEIVEESSCAAQEFIKSFEKKWGLEE